VRRRKPAGSSSGSGDAVPDWALCQEFGTASPELTPASPELTAVNRHREEIIAAYESFNPENKNHQCQVHRQAVRKALIRFGLLTTTRRSIPLPLKRKKGVKICERAQRTAR
jgi:hypothetical protein